MKKILISLWLLLISCEMFSQTNIFPSNGNVGVGTLVPDLKFHVNGPNAYPSTSGSAPNGMFTLRDKTNGASHGLFFGVGNTAPWGSWIQAQDANSLGTNYPLLLNPNGGNVGIGTTNPNSLLTIKTNSDQSPDGIRLMGTNYGGYTKLSSGDAIDGVLSSFSHQFKIAIKDFQNPELIAFQTQMASGRLTAAFPNANVGIGTVTPEAKFHINGSGGSINGTAALLLSDENSAGSRRWSISNGAGGNAVDLIGKLVFSVGAGSFSANPMNGIPAMVLNASGYLGVGTTNPTEKLTVNGNISASGYITTKKLTVTQLGWSDYVFNEDYKLRSLSSLEQYIKQHKHLPEIPSAKEVEEKGISVGDNQALLLKKIEELSLYLIEQSKQIMELNFKNKELFKQIDKLKKSSR